jgi:hypothetical protein
MVASFGKSKGGGNLEHSWNFRRWRSELMSVRGQFLSLTPSWTCPLGFGGICGIIRTLAHFKGGRTKTRHHTALGPLWSFVLICGLSYKTTFSKELWISSFPLYLM